MSERCDRGRRYWKLARIVFGGIRHGGYSGGEYSLTKRVPRDRDRAEYCAKAVANGSRRVSEPEKPRIPREAESVSDALRTALHCVFSNSVPANSTW